MWGLVLQPGMEPGPPALGAQSLSLWTTREVPKIFIYTPKIDYSRQISFIACPSFPHSSDGNESTCNVGDSGSIPGSGRSAGEGIGYPLQYSWASLVAQLAKTLPAMQETWVGKIPWRREWLPTSIFWPGEFHGLYSPWGCKELDMTERLTFTTWKFSSLLHE